MASSETNISQIETLADKLQFLGIIPGPQQYYYQFLTANTGLVGSLGDLVDKIDNGTATRNDYIDVLKDIGAIGTSAAALAALTGMVSVNGGVLLTIGLGLAVLDYADEHNYDLTEIYEDLKSKMDMLKDYLNGDTPAPDDLTYDPKNFDPNTPTDSTPLNPKDGHPFAPLPPLQRRDPLVLDMNKDGLISTVSLADSTAFFDLTGDGIKEKVGWVQASEGIVAFDKNGNGKIDGISEVFGTATTSGFDELRTLADSNYDGVIDRRDELYNQLKVWQEEVNCEARETTLGCTNQDGISQASELKTLSQAGVNNIELNVFATNINLNGNLLTEAGRYADSTEKRKQAAIFVIVNNRNFKNKRIVG